MSCIMPLIFFKTVGLLCVVGACRANTMVMPIFSVSLQFPGRKKIRRESQNAFCDIGFDSAKQDIMHRVLSHTADRAINEPQNCRDQKGQWIYGDPELA